MLHRIALSMILAGAVALATGCGGGSSTTGPSGSGGGSSTAVVQGQVTRTSTAANGESVIVVALRTALGVGLAEAATGTPVEGATVKLTCGSFTDMKTTDKNGTFVFQNAPVGSCLVEVFTGTPPVLVASTPVTVGAGDNAIVGVVTASGTPPTVTVTAESTDTNNDAQMGHAMNIDNASSSCDLVQIWNFREQGNGWGEIARKCNVSPGVIGLGRSNLSDADLESGREQLAKAGKGNGAKGGKGGKKA